MIGRSQATLMALTAFVVMACAVPGRNRIRTDLTLDEALGQLQRIITDTAETVAPGVEWQLDQDIGPRGCEDAEVAPHLFHTWGITIPVAPGHQPAELLAAVEAYWVKQ